MTSDPSCAAQLASAKDGNHDCAEDAAHAVHRKDIQRVVDAQLVADQIDALPGTEHRRLRR